MSVHRPTVEIAAQPNFDIRPLQNLLTRFAKELDLFFASSGITYYLMGGTALGAMRHEGFIPWDDDFDIFMDRKNYLRFLAVCEHSLDNTKYYLQKEDTDEWPLFFSKIRLNDTLYVERQEDMGRIHNGIYIDVICLHNAFSNRWLRYLQYLSARLLSAIGLSRRGYTTRSWVKRITLLGIRIFGLKLMRPLFLKFVRCLDNCDTELVGHFFGRSPFINSSFPRVYLGTPRRVPFENERLPVPIRVEDYLVTRFGSDFMNLPSRQVRDMYPGHLISYDLGPYG